MDRSEFAVVIEALKICGAIEWLRAVEGDSVEILCDNPDPDTRDRQCGVNCNGEWTHWAPEIYYGESVLAALEKAVAERQRRESISK